MKTEELWDENKHDSWVMYKKDFMFCLGEKDAGIVKIIDEMIKEYEGKYNLCVTEVTKRKYNYKIEALTDLKEKL